MWVLQVCHSYYPPFLDCARQGSQLFKGTPFKVLTVYLTGKADQEVARQTDSDQVIFMGYASHKVGGLKLGAIRQLRRIANEKKVAFCFTHRAKPTYVALLATGLPVVSLRHNYDDFKRWGRRLLVNMFRKRLLLLGVSDSVRDDMRQRLPHWPQQQIQTLYNHIDVDTVQAEQISREEARTHLQLPRQAWIVGNVGRLHRDKDQATLIRAFHAALPFLPVDSLLVIMGAGPLQAQLQALVAELDIGNKVMFTGNVTNARRYFKAFDVFALSSDHEPFGMVLLEAMAAGLPLICSDSGGGADVVRGVGELFPLRDTQALAKCLHRAHVHAATLDAGTIDQYLRANFSDQTARQQFWRMPQPQAWSAQLQLENVDANEES